MPARLPPRRRHLGVDAGNGIENTIGEERNRAFAGLTITGCVQSHEAEGCWLSGTAVLEAKPDLATTRPLLEVNGNHHETSNAKRAEVHAVIRLHATTAGYDGRRHRDQDVTFANAERVFAKQDRFDELVFVCDGFGQQRHLIDGFGDAGEATCDGFAVLVCDLLGQPGICCFFALAQLDGAVPGLRK